MTITSAILEFLVLGCLWICVLLVSALLLVVSWRGSWPHVNLGGAEALFTLLGIPVAYAVGVVLQAATWQYWYKKVHRRALDKELLKHQTAYQILAEDLQRRGVKIGLVKEQLETGKDLGGLLDVLRWELMSSAQGEPAQQYLIQFHLYRILYGSIPPLLFLGVMLGLGIGVAWRMGSWFVAVGFLLAGAFSLLLARLAWEGAKHRRARTWKYLVFGVQALRAGFHQDTPLEAPAKPTT